MAQRNLSLSLAFISSHPDAAAHTLERLDLGSVAQFLTTLPESHTRRLTPRLLPRYLGRLSEFMDIHTIARILADQDASYIAAVMRHLPAATRNKVMTKLPANRRAACNLLLGFSSDTVGAWQTPLVATVANDCSIGEALEHIDITGENAYTEYVFVVNRDRFLQGRVRYLDLVRAENNLPVTTVMDKSIASLPGRLSLQRAAEHAAWAGADVMPVNNRSSQFIGVIRHVDLRKGLDQLGTGVHNPDNQEFLGGFMKIYGESMLALFNTLGESLDTSAQKKGED